MTRTCWLSIALVLSACDGGSKTTGAAADGNLWSEFSGENALRHVQQLVDFGPRPAGSEALERSRDYITKQLEAMGWVVVRQTFIDSTPRGSMTFTNLIAKFKSAKAGKEAPFFLLCSHYDTKLFETASFVGANDGGSSNGLLLELARLLGARADLAAKVQLVFFDGEEAYVAFTETDGLYGSRHFAKQLAESGQAKQFRGGILFDMVGDRDLTITLSPDSPTAITRDIFAAADALKVRKHFTYADNGIVDDHTPLNAIGIPTIDLIDFDYPAWHTPADTMETISAESLDIVGTVAAYYLAEVALK